MTDLHQEMTKQPPHVSCPQDTDQLTLLSLCINNFASLPRKLSLPPTQWEGVLKHDRL